MAETQAAVPRLAAWSARLTRDDIPDNVRAVARSCLIDTLGVAIAGSTTPVARIARRVAAATAASGRASVLGQPGGFSAPTAAFVNGASAHALDFDDNCYAGVVHGSAVIAPAVLATGEVADISGADLLTAFVAGSETEYAVGVAAGLSLYDRGWWTTGVLGPIGAAAASAHVLGLDPAQTAAAIGIAVSGAGGAKACFGTDGKPLLCGRAAEAGVVAALLAQQGATGPLGVLEHARGFAGLMNGGAFDQHALDDLGASWRLLAPGIDVKRIPVCLSSHAAVDAVIDLVTQHAIAVDAIAHISCDVPPIVTANLAYDRPSTPQEAQFSMQFAVAVSLLHGDLGLHHLTPAVLADPQLRALMARITMHTGPRWANPTAREAAPEGALVCLTLTDGRILDRFRDFADGSAALPLTPSRLDAKFLACTQPVLGDARAHALLSRLHDVDRLASVRDLVGSSLPA